MFPFRKFDDASMELVRSAPEKVVLVHCSASSAGQWRSLEAQIGADFTTIPVELRGHGQCDAWPGDGPLCLAAEAEGIARAVKGNVPFHLIGHSYGGGVALRYALSYPERLTSLTLIEPSCFHVLKEADEEAHLLDEIRAIANAVNIGVISGDYRSGMETFVDYWGGAGSWARFSDERRDRLAHLSVHVAHHFWGLIEEETPLAAYGAIDAPTLILCGTRSPAPSRAITRLLTEAIPGARHRTIAGANHMVPITHPDQVNPIILDHLRQSKANRPKPARTTPPTDVIFIDRNSDAGTVRTSRADLRAVA